MRIFIQMLKMITQFLLWLLLPECILAQTDCPYLVYIYFKMGGDVSKIPQNCCEMFRVQCSQDGHVTEINWNQQDLTGSIPQEIGNLKNLEML